MLGPKLFPAEAAGKGGNISNQVEVIKARFGREGETFGDDRVFRGGERLGGVVNNRMGWIDRIGVSVGRRGLKFEGGVAGM